jgi:uridylate kinase
MRVVLRIGGSVVASPVDPKLISKYVNVLRELKNRGHEVVVVVGGGKLAREFIETARELELEEKDQDEIAISVSRIFAQLFLKKLGEMGCTTVPLTLNNAIECLHKKKIVVMGGLKPGMTTDTVAALLAERIDADLLVKATDQEGIYNKDPKKYEDAVKLDHLSFEDLSTVLAENEHKAGIHQILDPEAVKILKRKQIKIFVFNGFKPDNVLSAIEGKHVGTLIE